MKLEEKQIKYLIEKGIELAKKSVQITYHEDVNLDEFDGFKETMIENTLEELVKEEFENEYYKEVLKSLCQETNCNCATRNEPCFRNKNKE